jgi:AraC-like DNA-binding protein
VLGAKTLGTAFRRLTEYFPLIQDATSLKLEVEEQWASLNYKILDPDIWPRHEDAMYSLGIYAVLIKTAAPEAWGQVELSVESEPDAVKGDLSHIVHANVVYGAQANALRFPTAILNCALNVAPPVDARHLADMSRALTKKRRATPMSERVRQMIFAEISDGSVSQEYVARELGVSSRTLRRKLATEGESYQSLLDECRMRVAALEFRTRDILSLSEMALKLGYSEHSTFSRAFARWAGVPPQEYRRAVSIH